MIYDYYDTTDGTYIVYTNFMTLERGAFMVVSEEPEPDPYEEGGYTEPEGGDGNWDGTSDTVAVPSTPSIDVTTTGMITLYNPTEGELGLLATFLHSDNALFEAYKAMFGNINECLLGLGIIPYSFSSSEVTQVSNVVIGNIESGISMNKIDVQYVKVDMGSLNIAEFYGSFLDYSPYTQIEIYLPYIGTKTIDADIVMGKTLAVKYMIDVATGMCVAHLSVDGCVMYSFSGECMSLIPLTNSNYAQILQSHLNCAVSAITNVAKIVATEGAYTGMGVANMVGTTLENAPNLFKPHIQKTGSVSTTAGMLSPQTPYLIITRNVPAIPRENGLYNGYLSHITERLDLLRGFTQVEEIHLENVPATSDEIEEILTLLKEGVIL